jgi:hypothetical protein
VTAGESTGSNGYGRIGRTEGIDRTGSIIWIGSIDRIGWIDRIQPPVVPLARSGAAGPSARREAADSVTPPSFALSAREAEGAILYG